MWLHLFFAVLLVAGILLPPYLSGSDSVQVFIRVFGAAGGLLGYPIGRQSAKWRKRYRGLLGVAAFGVFLLSVVLLVGLLRVIEPSFVARNPYWTSTREALLMPGSFYNWLVGAATAICCFVLTATATGLAGTTTSPSPKWADLDPQVKYLAGCTVLALLAALAFALLPRLTDWTVRGAVVVFVVLLVWLYLLSPQFFYRRVVEMLISAWITLRFAVHIAAEGTPWGNYFLNVGERIDSSFNWAVVAIVAILLLFDYLAYRQRNESSYRAAVARPTSAAERSVSSPAKSQGNDPQSD